MSKSIFKSLKKVERQSTINSINITEMMLFLKTTSSVICRRYVPGEEDFWNTWPRSMGQSTRTYKSKLGTDYDRVIVVRGCPGLPWRIPAKLDDGKLCYHLPAEFQHSVGRHIRNDSVTIFD